MKNALISVDAARIEELSSLLNDSRRELLALQAELTTLKKINISLDHRLDVVRSWALRNIHVRNELAKHASEAAAKNVSTAPIQ